jgi:hypothetical protein
MIDWLSSHAKSGPRSDPRIPSDVQVVLKTPTEQLQVRAIEVSADRFLFQTEAAIPMGSQVEFTVEIPAKAFRTEQPVPVKCHGRVVPCSEDVSGRSVAVVIDFYEFARQRG